MLFRRCKLEISTLVLAAMFAGVAPASASTMTFSVESTFVSQTGSTLLTLPNGTFTTPFSSVGGQLEIDGLDGHKLITGTSAYGTFFNSTANFSTNFMAKSGTESFNAIPLTPSYAFGFTLYEPTSPEQMNGCNFACTQSTFSITLLSGATNIGSYSVEPADKQFNFYGFWSTNPITSVQIRETTGTDDNEFFGRFYLGPTAYSDAPVPVPEPVSLLLLTIGLAGLGLVGNRGTFTD